MATLPEARRTLDTNLPAPSSLAVGGIYLIFSEIGYLYKAPRRAPELPAVTTWSGVAPGQTPHKEEKGRAMSTASLV